MKFLFAILLLLSTISVPAQGGFRSRIYLPGAVNHQAKAIFETSPGNYIAAGFAWDTAGWPQAINRLTIMGLDSVGKLKWYKQYGSLGFFYYNNMFIARSYYRHGNHIYYTGCVRDSVTNKDVGVLTKFDFNGDTVWQKVYRDPDPQEDVIPQMVTAGVDGGFLITGLCQHWGAAGGRRCLLIKTDAQGNELWRKKISKPAPNVQDGKAIVQDPVTKNIVIVGYQYTSGSGTFGNVLVLDSLGNELNRQSFIRGPLLDLIQISDNRYVTCGISSAVLTDHSIYGGYIAGFSAETGTFPDWNISFPKNESYSGTTCLKPTNDGGFVAMGRVGYQDSVHYMTHEDIVISLIGSTGKKKWKRIYPYKDNAPDSHFFLSPNSLEFTSDGGMIASIEFFHSPQSHPFFFVKYDSTGCDSTTAYCESLVAGSREITGSLTGSFKMFPNPATDNIQVVINGEVTGRELSVTDVTGKELLLVHRCPPKINLDVSGFQNGLYLVILRTNGTTTGTAKLVIQR